MKVDTTCEDCSRWLEAGTAAGIVLVRELAAKEEAKPPSKSGKTRQARKTRIAAFRTVERRLLTIFDRQTRQRRRETIERTLQGLCL